MVWVLIGFSLVVIIDFLPLVHQKNKKAIILFIIVFIFAFAYNMLQVFNVEVKSSLLIIVDFLRSLGINYPPLN